MDRKSFALMLSSLVVLFGLFLSVDHFFPPHPAPFILPIPAATNTRNSFSAANSTTAAAETTFASSNISGAGNWAGPEQLIGLTNENLILLITSHGGGLKSILLRDFPAVINRTKKTLLESNLATLNKAAPQPVLAVLNDGSTNAGEFRLTQYGQTVRAERTLSNGLHLVKEFQISTNYLFTAQVRMENTGAQSLNLPAREIVTGTAAPIGPLDDPSTLGTFWYNGIKAQNIKQPWFANKMLGCAVLPGTPRSHYEEGSSNVVWAAAHNQFFTLAAIPSNPAPRLMIEPVDLPVPQMDGLSNSTTLYLTNGYQSSFWYPATTLASRQSWESSFTFYAGPKKYNRLAEIGDRMNNNLDLIMDFSGPIGFFSKMLLVSMNGLNALGLGYGWTIIAITLIIKAIFWPLTRASTRSQKRMQALQPQMKAIADKYKDDPIKKNQKTMDFMKEHKVSPLGSCLPMLFQIPVFLGFYWMLRNAIELRGVHFLWAHDLSQPDTVGFLPAGLPFLGGFPINPLPLIMGATQLWQAQILPPSPGMDPGQQKIMRYMPLIFIAAFYKMSAGLTLYWTVQNLLGILQTNLTKSVDVPAATVPVNTPRRRS